MFLFLLLCLDSNNEIYIKILIFRLIPKTPRAFTDKNKVKNNLSKMMPRKIHITLVEVPYKSLLGQTHT